MENKLKKRLDNYINDNPAIPGIIASIQKGKDRIFSAASGFRTLDSSKTINGNNLTIHTEQIMQPADAFFAGSILKSFVSTIILKMVEDGAIALDMPITDILPETIGENVNCRINSIQHVERITVRMLLNHTSGIADWCDEVMIRQIMVTPERVWEEAEFVEYGATLTPSFAPSESWEYSNTNYSLLSYIANAALKKQGKATQWREEIVKQILNPLQLKGSRLLAPSQIETYDGSSAYYLDETPHQTKSSLYDLTLVNSSMAGAAGGNALSTTTEDLNLFYRALLNGKLFQSPSTLDEMMTFVQQPNDGSHEAHEYGLGLGKYHLNELWAYGHTGGAAGHSSFSGYLPEIDTSVSLAVNIFRSNHDNDVVTALGYITDLLLE